MTHVDRPVGPGDTSSVAPRTSRRVDGAYLESCVSWPAPTAQSDSEASFQRWRSEVLVRWRERDVFAQSIERRRGGPRWGLLEGPPTANGAPGAHHVLARAFKDIFPRYRAMCGYHVDRKGGWDCHGLPVELAVEAELGLTAKTQIEEYGIAEFNAALP